jgi:hypothetical protein
MSAQNGRIETVAVSHHQLHPSAMTCLDHVVAFAQVNGHGFFDPNMLAMFGSHGGMHGMQAVRGRNVNQI